jgi:hypothetical protein
VRRRGILALLIACAALVAVGGMAWQLFSRDQSARLRAVRDVGRSPSVVDLSLTVDYAGGRVAREAYAMVDDNGNSYATYAVSDRAGSTAHFREPVPGYGVSFLFDRLVADGIWELTDKPPRGDTSARYAVSIAQTVGGQHGGRTVTFTDPHYWATTAGRQFKIHLEKDKPTPDLLTLEGTSIADPRYAKVVADFRAFGSPAFKATIRQARLRLGLPP